MSLKSELRQNLPFASREQEAHLSIGRCWALLDRAVSTLLVEYGITPTQYNVLRILRGSGPQGLCRGEVVERMVTSVPDASRLLDRMEKAGWLVRTRGGEDRRYVRACISDSGLKILDQLDAPVLKLHREIFQVLNDSELDTLIDLLARIRTSVGTE